MKKTTLLKTMLLLCALIVGSSSAWADITSPWSHTFSTTEATFTEDGTETLSGVDWTLAVTWAGTESDYNKDGDKGMKIGSNSKVPSSMTLSTDGIEGIIKKVSVTTCGRSKSTCTVGVTVDGTDFTTNDSWGAGTLKKMIFTGEESGEIVITWTQGTSNKGAFYVSEITVEFESSDGSYSVTYDANGATSGTVPTDNTSYTEESNTVTVLGNTGNLAKVHYTFGGWNTKADGTGTNYTAGNTFTITESTRLYAKWNANTNTITLPTADTYGTYSMNVTNPVAYGTEVTLTYNPAADYENYVATWSVNGTEIDGNKFSMPDEAVTVTVAVAEYEQPTDITAIFNNVFLGTVAGERITKKTTVKQDGVSFTFDSSGSNWPQGDAGLIRIYQGNTLTISAPSGYYIKEITFINSGDWKNGMTADIGDYDDVLDSDKKTYWTGFAEDVTFTPGGAHRITSVNVVLTQNASVTITSATWASFSCVKALDFTNTVVKAYIAKTKDASTVTLTDIKKVPANTGIVVNAAEGTYSVPVLSGDADDTTGNLLQPWLKTGEPTATNYYTLAVNGTAPVFKKSSGGDLAAGKAYLVVPSTSRELNVSFDEEGNTTAIDVISKTEDVRGEVYNLNGQRVAQPTKGLYIVNGKKVVVK